MYKGLASLTLGIVVGAFYALLRVRSPAPPVIALVGLLGMWLGESTTERLRTRHSGLASPEPNSAEPDQRARSVHPCAH